LAGIWGGNGGHGGICANGLDRNIDPGHDRRPLLLRGRGSEHQELSIIRSRRKRKASIRAITVCRSDRLCRGDGGGVVLTKGKAVLCQSIIRRKGQVPRTAIVRILRGNGIKHADRIGDPALKIKRLKYSLPLRGAQVSGSGHQDRVRARRVAVLRPLHARGRTKPTGGRN